MEEERTITLDLGSSPDPLIDPALSPPMMPPSHIKKKSQAAERLYTVLAPSPRKQTFELDVGNELAPQRLLVTVEAEDDRSRSTSTSRRLFQSPTPKRRATPRRATTVSTTTVPLRGLSDDEGAARSNATPKRRGRPRKSGTPVPARRKRPGTPARSRKSGAHTSVSPEKDILTSDAIDQSTPRPSSQPRSAAKRKASSPPKDGGAPASQPRKRGRPRKQTLNPDDISRPPAADHHYSEPKSQLPRAEPDSQHQYDWPEMGDGPDSHSDVGSLASADHDDHDVGEDTIMAGEEFTMISLGSLPSMQPNSSVVAPQHQEDLGETTSMIISEALEYLRRSRNKSTEEGINEESATTAGKAEAAPTAAETAEEIPVQQSEEPQPSPPQSKSPQPWWNRSPRRAKAQPLAKQLAQKTLQQAERQSPAPPAPQIGRAEAQDASAYEDSFSSIPEAVLAAATPRRSRQAQSSQAEEEPAVEDIQPSIERPSRVNHSNPQSETNRLLTPDETPSPIPSDAADHEPQPNAPIPAPDVDVPSSPPIGSPLQHPIGSETHQTRRNSTETPADQLTSFTSSNTGIRAVPPIPLPAPEPQRRPTLSPIVRAGRALQLITSDPPSPPGRDSVLGSPFRGSSVPKSSQSPAPVLPPPAPAPAARASRSPVQPQTDAVGQTAQRSWLAPLSQLKDFFVRSARSPSPARRVSVSGTEGMDDPFGPDPGESTGSGSVRGTLFSGLNTRAHDRDATISVASSPRAGSVHDEDAISRPGAGNRVGGSQRPASPRFDHFSSRGSSGAGRGWLRNSEPSTNRAESAMAPEAPRPQADLGQQADVHDEQQEEEEEEEEEDIWAIEAQRPTPYAPRTGPARGERMIEPLRRGKIPSPRRQHSRRPVYSDELEQFSDTNDAPSEKAAPLNEGEVPSIVSQSRGEQVPVRFDRNLPTNEEEEFSLLAQNRQKKAPTPANPPGRKPDLSAFFSSPAMLPEMPEAPGAGVSKTLDARRPEQSNPVLGKPRAMPVQKPQSSGHSLFSQYPQSQAQTQMPSIPQKRLEIGTRQRSVDLFSPPRKASERNGTEHPAPPAPRSASLERPEEVRPVHIPQQMGRVPHQRQSTRLKTAPAPVPRTASPESAEEEASPAHIPQKMNFTPRQRQSNSTLFQPKPVVPTNSLFGNSQISAFFSRSRPQAQRPSGRREQDHEEEEEPSFAPPAPKPLAGRAVSPAKSSFRSPLKPKTPGHVVEFTSSTLSPLAQGQARAGRRETMSPERDQDVRAQRGKGSGTGNASSGGQAGRDQPSESPSVSPSPSPSPEPRPRFISYPFSSFTRPSTVTNTTSQSKSQSTPASSLSPTHWTRAHWLRLDELLQARKRGILPFQLEASRRRARSSSRNSTSIAHSNSSSRHLLGKIVTSQGETMVLEQWHLDVVDAFRNEFPDGRGWDEATLAKRVFALLVGEERRRLGLVPLRRRNSSLNGVETRGQDALVNGTGGVEAESDGEEIDWEAV
ncbi:hypothetical protein C8A03DRAFT_15833 [Achaetomium macrosporum]|uniref:Uncharacterized protein n=1 Tax=Achaetomium macrosporum TaxID=79813 RepID=A0AAN7HAE8_9PEZI|nr:hypothetical protein C8A03DRAFT_15833 [Achaetomium macrosporum]